ncbi:MAG: imelysin family protein [Polyangiales bacterium]
MTGWKLWVAAAACVWTVGCGASDDGASTPSAVPSAEAAPVVARYVAGVRGSYEQTAQAATAMQTAVGAFLDAPSEQTLTAARQAWIAAREPYGQTEAFRFYGGPIDDEAAGNLEGRINAWPMDENFVDYVMGMPGSGIINDLAGTPTITRDALVMANERGGEENIATGWHAIEFLLWGQDMNANGPGARPYTDYLTSGGTAANQERRREYLRLVTAQLVDDLTTVRDAWAPGSTTNYAAGFGTDTTVALRRMLTGMGSLSGAELAGERS